MRAMQRNQVFPSQYCVKNQYQYGSSIQDCIKRHIDPFLAIVSGKRIGELHPHKHQLDFPQIFNARWPGRTAGSSCSRMYYTKIVFVTTKVKIFIDDKKIERGSSSWQDDCGSHGTVFICPADDHDTPRCHALKMPESLSSL